MITETFWIHGMTGEISVRTVNSELNQLPVGIRKIDLGSAVVEYDPTRVPRSQIELAISQAGFQVSGPAETASPI